MCRGGAPGIAGIFAGIPPAPLPPGMAAFPARPRTPITLGRAEMRVDLHGAACYAKIALCSEAISYGKSLLTTRRLNSVVCGESGFDPTFVVVRGKYV